MLSLLYNPTLTSIHDYWKNHSFDYMDLVSKVMSDFFFNLLQRLRNGGEELPKSRVRGGSREELPHI